ncbi:hypothetical protein [Flavobacterium sp.]|uniref:hypothetical protein n=1 Tax=Flavobacterium sp. TaxID=239 RepID=UPI003BEF4048
MRHLLENERRKMDKTIMNTENVKLCLKNKWNINPFDFWIPLHGNVDENSIYFDNDDFEEFFGYDRINKILKEINVGRIYSFNEANEEKSYSEILIKEYNSPDIFITNENADWVIYQTHENTIAFAGMELIEKIKSNWTNWKEKVNPWE